jgi:hypothetical protein
MRRDALDETCVRLLHAARILYPPSRHAGCSTPNDAMATKLDKTLKREIAVHGKPFVLSIAPQGLKLVGKGRRKGLELAWEDLVSGDAALATALNASVAQRLALEPSSNNNPSRRQINGRSQRRRSAR